MRSPDNSSEGNHITPFREYLKSHSRVLDALFLLILAVVIFLAKMNVVALPYHWDDSVYINPSHWLVNTNFIHVLPGLHPPELFYGHPFGLPLVLAILFRIFGENPSVAHIFMLALTTIGVWHTYLLGKLLHGRIAGAMAAFLLFFSPMYFAQSGMVNGDIAIAALGVMTIYYALTQRYISYFIVASLLLMTKESSIAIIISLVILFYFSDGMTQGFKKITKYSIPVFFKSIRIAAEAIIQKKGKTGKRYRGKKNIKVKAVTNEKIAEKNIIYSLFIARLPFKNMFSTIAEASINRYCERNNIFTTIFALLIILEISNSMKLLDLKYGLGKNEPVQNFWATKNITKKNTGIEYLVIFLNP